MLLSEIRDFIEHPTQPGLDRLVASHRDGTGSDERLLRFLVMRGVEVVRSSWDSDIIVLVEDAFHVDGGMISEDEYSEEGFTCEHCNEIHHVENSTSVDVRGSDQSWCTSCFRADGFNCEHCNDAHQDSDGVTDVTTDEMYCASCAETILEYCSDCGHISERCSSCPLDNEDDDDDDYPSIGTSVDISGMIVNYTYDVVDHFKVREGGVFRSLPEENLPERPLFLGVELEAHHRVNSVNRSRAIKWTYEKVNSFACLKLDASVPYDGFEVVSVPATLAYHRKAWGPFLEEAYKHLQSWHSGNCGIHVHMSRDALTNLQLGKMMVFINHDSNSDFIRLMAGRGDTQYTQRTAKTPMSGLRKNVVAHRSRYEALSVSAHTNAKTVELRIFRGNVRASGFFRCLDFTVAMADFCSICSIREVTGPSAFLAWMSRPEQGGKYPYLANFLADKKLIEVKRPELVDAEPA